MRGAFIRRGGFVRHESAARIVDLGRAHDEGGGGATFRA